MAKKSIGLLNIVFGADLRGFDRAMKKAQKSITKFGNKMGNIGKKLSTNVTLPIIGLGAAAVKMAADFEETESKFNIVFRHLADDVRGWAKITGEAIGRSQIEMLGFLSTLQDTFVPLGFSREKAADFSKTLTTLAFDLASFNNVADADVIKALQSAIVGNHETMRAYGVVINQAGINQELLNMGVKGGVKNASEAQKAQARLNLIMAGTIDAQGNALETAGSLTNQVKQLTAQVTNLAVEFGHILIPFTKSLVSALKDVASWMSNLSLETKEGIVKWAGYVAVLGPVVIGVSKIILAFSYLLPWIHKIGKAIVWLGAKMLTMIKRNPWLLIATAVAGVGVAIADAMGAFDKWLGKTDDIADSGEEAAGSVDDLTKALKDLDKQLDKPKPTGKGKGFTPTAIPSLGPTLMPVEEGGPIGSVGAAITDILRKQEQLNAATALFGDIMHNAMMDAANSQEGFFQSLFENLKRAIKQMLIQLAVLTAINIMLGGKGITGVEAFANAKNSLLGLANGGLATGPTLALVGEGAGTSISNPEVIAPLDQLKKLYGWRYEGNRKISGE